MNLTNYHKKLIWKSRRGLLELDLILSKFVQTELFLNMSKEYLIIYDKILDLQDYELLNIINSSNNNISNKYSDNKTIELLNSIRNTIQ